ncbi:MAG TPA: hypothetical protein DCZ72_13250 [Armatimonadetes bacterium]|nr:hypothetical protein [Armatimonadota bacterium]
MDGWAVVVVCADQHQAFLVASLLRSAGLMARVDASDTAGWQPFLTIDSGGYRVVVPDDQAEEANRIVASLPEDDPEAAEDEAGDDEAEWDDGPE